MLELRIIECIFDQLLRQVQESREKRFIIFILRLVKSPNLTQPSFKHTGKNTAKVRSRNQHNCTSVLYLPKYSAWLKSKNIAPWTKNLLPVLPLPGGSAQKF
jgi:hypothetical protein